MLHLFTKPADSPLEPLLRGNLGLPFEPRARFIDIGSASLRVFNPLLFKENRRFRGAEPDHHLCPVQDRMFFRIAEIENLAFRLGHEHCPYQPIDEVIDVADATGLLPISVYGNRLIGECLDDEVWNHSPIIQLAIGAIGVKYAHDSGIKIILAMKLRGNRFTESLALIIAGARPSGVDVAPVLFSLRVYQGIPLGL